MNSPSLNPMLRMTEKFHFQKWQFRRPNNSTLTDIRLCECKWANMFQALWLLHVRKVRYKYTIYYLLISQVICSQDLNELWMKKKRSPLYLLLIQLWLEINYSQPMKENKKITISSQNWSWSMSAYCPIWIWSWYISQQRERYTQDIRIYWNLVMEWTQLPPPMR